MSAETRPSIVLAHMSGFRLFRRRHLAQLEAVGVVLDPDPLSTWDDRRADGLLGRAQVIVGHWGCPPITAGVLERAPHLELFAYAAGTVKGVVDDSIFERGIRVTSGAPANAEPVAEYTLAAILFALKDVFWARDVLRDPSTLGARRLPSTPPGNWGKSVGVVGASLVGRRVIELLAAFPQVRVLLHDPYLDDASAAALGAEKVELDELCRAVDVLSIHAPALPETEHMIGAAQLAALRTGATVVNTARGSLVDHDALVAELVDGRLYAVLDVTDPEPLPDDSTLRRLPNVFLTPHIAGSGGSELHRLIDHVVDEVRRWASSEPARNQVQREQLPRLA